MTKRVCSHLEKEWQELGAFAQLKYKCKFSRITNGATSQKRLCKECIKQTELEFK